MSVVTHAPEVSRSLPPSFLERYKTTSAEMAIAMKVRPSGIVLHHCKASGFQLGSPSRAVECVGRWGVISSNVPRERGWGPPRIYISLRNPEQAVIGEVARWIHGSMGLTHTRGTKKINRRPSVSVGPRSGWVSFSFGV